MPADLPGDGALLLNHRAARLAGGALSINSIDLAGLQAAGLVVFMCDDFRVRGHPFGPHPHAGFSAVTYVFEDSISGLRSRDSLGNDLVVAPGGMVWTQAGVGALHEEMPALPGGELHGLQVFVNLPAALKLTPPQVLHLDGPDVPTWTSPSGDRVRVLVGRHADQHSPLQPQQPLRWLDVALHDGVDLSLSNDERMLVYASHGDMQIEHAQVVRTLPTGRALLLAGRGGPVRLRANRPARAIVISAPALHEPMVGNGPFMMSSPQQLQDAVRRYQSGEMGRLVPLAG